MEKINEERKNRNIPPLFSDNRLSQAATEKTGDMFERDYFDHVNPDGNFVWPIIQKTGYYPYRLLGENLAIDFTTESGVVKAWLNSPSHRENLLNAEFADQGMSAQYGDYQSRYTSLVTNLFGTLVESFSSNPSPPPQTPPAPQTPTPTPTPQPQPKPTQASPPTPAPGEQVAVEETTYHEPENKTKNEPAVILTLGPTDVSGPLSGTQKLTIEIPKKLNQPNLNILNVVRTVFIILVIMLIFTIFVDIFIIKRSKKYWASNTHLPMLLMLLFTSLLTIRLY